MAKPLLTDAQALYQAILANPDDDAPRLVLADWYEEHDQPERAEYIRLECQIARDPFADEFHPQRQRVKQLEQHKSRWASETPTPIAGVYGSPEWERGFNHQASFASVAALKNGWPRVRKTWPVTHVNIRNNKPIDGLESWPHLKSIRGLSFTNAYHYLTHQSLAVLLQSSHWSQLQELVWIAPRTNSGVMTLLAQSPACRHLRTLAIGYDRGNGEDCFAELGQLTQLRDLRMIQLHATSTSFNTFTHSPTLRIQRLVLGIDHNHAYISSLLNSPMMNHLKSLSCMISDWQTFHLLMTTPLPKNLRELRLDIHTHIGHEHLQSLNGFRGLEHLWSLTIDHLATTPELLPLILVSPYARNLKYLNIQHVHLPERIAQELLELSMLPQLDYISFNTSEVARSTEALLRERFPSLECYARQYYYR